MRSPILTYSLEEEKMKEYIEMIGKWQNLALDLDRLNNKRDELSEKAKRDYRHICKAYGRHDERFSVSSMTRS